MMVELETVNGVRAFDLRKVAVIIPPYEEQDQEYCIIRVGGYEWTVRKTYAEMLKLVRRVKEAK